MISVRIDSKGYMTFWPVNVVTGKIEEIHLRVEVRNASIVTAIRTSVVLVPSVLSAIPKRAFYRVLSYTMKQGFGSLALIDLYRVKTVIPVGYSAGCPMTVCFAIPRLFREQRAVRAATTPPVFLVAKQLATIVIAA